MKVRLRNIKLWTLPIVLFFAAEVVEIKNSSRTGNRSHSERPDGTAVEVPLEDAATIAAISPELDTVRQVLKIIELQHVQPERLSPLLVLKAGVSALSKDYGGEIEFGRILPRVESDSKRRLTAFLCMNKKNITKFEFCEKNTESREQNKNENSVTLSAKVRPWGGASYQEDIDDSQSIPVIRVGHRVFFSSQQSYGGFRYVDSIVRPVLTEFSRRNSVPINKAIHAFLNGMLKELDPHSSYLSTDEYRDLRRGTRGQFGGVGLVFDDVHNLPVVREIVPNSPANLAGIEAGDILLRLGTAKVAFNPVDIVLQDIRQMTLTAPTPAWFFRPSSGRVVRVYLSRDVIPTQSVDARILPQRPDVLHVKLAGFSNRTARDLGDAIEAATEKNPGKIRALLLDLRGNPGGLLDQAVQVSDLFIKHGKIVTTRSRYEENAENTTATRKIDLPMIVLVNASSASASEIVAGALRDHGRALILGERTYGKGSVQSLFELDEGTALKLTMAHYFTPSGRSIQNLGVEPHIKIRLVQKKDDHLWMSGKSEMEREEDLAFHLDNPAQLLASRGDMDNFGDGTTPTIWSYTPSTLTSIQELSGLEFNYPPYELREANFQRDSFLRVAIETIDHMFARYNTVSTDPEAIKSVARSLQSIESHIISDNLAVNVAGAPSIPSSFLDISSVVRVSLNAQPQGDVLQKVLPLVQNFIKSSKRIALSAVALHECCDADDYSFHLQESFFGNEELNTGLVGARLENGLETPVVWIPTTLKKQDNGWVGRFKLPKVFRAYFSSVGLENPSSVGFYFKTRLDEPGIYVGHLGLSPRQPEQQSGVMVTNRSAQETKQNRFKQARLQVQIPLKNSSPLDSYSLTLVKLTDKNVEVDRDVVLLERISTGNLVGTFNVTVNKSNSGRNDFDGIIGGILRNSGGEILGKWSLCSVHNGSVEGGISATRTAHPLLDQANTDD